MTFFLCKCFSSETFASFFSSFSLCFFVRSFLLGFSVIFVGDLGTMALSFDEDLVGGLWTWNEKF
jgi:hypothetical protein